MLLLAMMMMTMKVTSVMLFLCVTVCLGLSLTL